jgi:hypothetical protein
MLLSESVLQGCFLLLLPFGCLCKRAKPLASNPPPVTWCFPASRLTGLLSVLRQHLRRWLPDLVGLLHDFWGAGSAVLPVLLELVAELASEEP